MNTIAGSYTGDYKQTVIGTDNKLYLIQNVGLDYVPTEIYQNQFDTEVMSVHSGGYKKQFLTVNGNVYMQGSNEYGQSGLGENITSVSEPTRIPNIQKIKKVALGQFHSSAISESNDVYMFGYNSNGQLGIGNYNNQYTPEVLNPDTFDNEKVIDVALSDNGSYFLTENNNIYTCGENYSGQLGLGFESSSVATPQKISNSDYNNENILKISAIDQTQHILTDQGKVYAVGNNSNGNLGLGSIQKTSTFQQIPQNYFNNEMVIYISNDGRFAITETNKIYAWGSNFAGELGLGDNNTRTLPQQLNKNKFNGDNIVNIYRGYQFTCFENESNELYVVGDITASNVADFFIMKIDGFQIKDSSLIYLIIRESIEGSSNIKLNGNSIIVPYQKNCNYNEKNTLEISDNTGYRFKEWNISEI